MTELQASSTEQVLMKCLKFHPSAVFEIRPPSDDHPRLQLVQMYPEKATTTLHGVLLYAWTSPDKVTYHWVTDKPIEALKKRQRFVFCDARFTQSVLRSHRDKVRIEPVYLGEEKSAFLIRIVVL